MSDLQNIESNGVRVEGKALTPSEVEELTGKPFEEFSQQPYGHIVDPKNSRRVRRAQAAAVLKDLKAMKRRQEMGNKYAAELEPLTLEELKALDIKKFSRTKVLVWGHIIDKKEKEAQINEGEPKDDTTLPTT